MAGTDKQDYVTQKRCGVSTFAYSTRRKGAENMEAINEREPGKHPTIRLHLLVGAALLILLIATAIAAFLPLGRLSTPVAVGIAIAKANLILLYFMNLRFGDKRLGLVAGAAFAWLSILFVLSLSDYLTRGYLHIAGK